MTETTAAQPQTTEEALDALMESNRTRPEGDRFAFALMSQVRDAERALNHTTGQLRREAERTRDRAAQVLADLDSGNARSINELGVLQSTDLDRLAGERRLAEKNMESVFRTVASYLDR